ncbi:endonuclease/exonuclease/phosphatase family metal-dependent hydrolase [Amycolatopsis bartoniae]|uniref:Uncharacterized protein n=1 Tax=Amycolatopsis bartoniae TaxID=941986 RepID=A0A8H9IWP8_9PSEU|nr:hypothetical protein [Amycolatopsis bartoniae]MBB2936741.1 endonuclease/exonuclease/phosphatase family metal-dependent hydrolase [Amycolatopsis bartoniae]TVT09206.1 hypothetical protein FNH07_09935 [Amycolatopsis bartoniae]GHF49820.1 hypothetical protein GCM10017566_23550 [Amycolatopsis bartoniae]
MVIRVAVLSRHPLTVLADTNELPAGLRPIQTADEPAEPQHTLSRGVLWVVVELDRPLTVVTCHLKSKLLTFPDGRFSPAGGGGRHRAGAGDRAPGPRVVVPGDLNDEPTAATTQILSGPPGSEIGTTGFAN